MAYNETWLLSGTANRIVLAVLTRYNVLSTLEESVYLSNKGLITTNADAVFLPVISTRGLQFNESLSINGGISASYGDLEIINADGSYDSWLDSTQYIWVNRSIKLYYGDASWVLDTKNNIATEFQLIFDGLIEDIDSKNRDSINIKVRDKMERLNYPVTEAKFPDNYGVWSAASANTNATLGIVFGEVHNITPLQIDPSTLEYLVSSVAIKEILEIRDNGVPVHSTITTPGITGAEVAANVTLGGTSYKLFRPLVGSSTVSVQGVNETIDLNTGATVPTTFSPYIASLVAYIVSKTGHATLRLNSTTEIDLPNFNTFNTANQKPVGIYINDNTSVISACQSLASSLGAQIYFNREGKLRIIQLGVYTNDPLIYITDSDIIHHSLQISGKTEVQAAVSINYCKNWTVQSGLETGIPQEHKDMFAKDWLLYTVDNPAVKTTYKLTADPTAKNTMLLTEADATTEANRLLAYYEVPRTVYSFTGTPRMQLLKLGQQVNITHNRFGLNGKVGQVISLSPNWSTGLVTVGVII